MSNPKGSLEAYFGGALGALACVIALWLGGVIQPFGPGGDDHKPDDDDTTVVITGIAKSVYRGNLDAAEKEAEICGEFADKLEAGKFKSASEFNTAFTKAMDDARRECFGDYGDAMKDAMESRKWGDEMAEILRAAQEGFEQFEGGARKARR